MILLRLVILLFLSILPLASAFAGAGEDIVGMMQTLQSNLGPVYTLVVALAYVMGIWFIADAIFRLKKYGQARTMMSTNTSLAKPIILMIIGAGLLYFPSAINTSIQTLWLYGSSSVVKYPTDTGMWTAFVDPLIDVTRLFGVIAVVRGLVILTRLAAENPQPGSLGKGLMHIVAGTLLINIVGTVDVVKATFGFS